MHHVEVLKRPEDIENKIRIISGIYPKRKKPTVLEGDFSEYSIFGVIIKNPLIILDNLKVIEGMLKADPSNETLLVLLAKSYGGYAFGFIEDHYLEWKEKDPKRAAYFKHRAEVFYLRGKDYALQALTQSNSSFSEALASDFGTFEQAVEKFGSADVPALFWTAYNWGNWINLNLHSPEAIAVAPKVERMMKKVLELDEKYFFAGPHLFYGVYYGARPPMLGGDKAKSKMHFEMALKFTNRKFLMTHVLYAQYYAVQTQDERLYGNLLKEVLNAPEMIYPEQSLITQLAKKKAQRLLAAKGKFF